MPTTYPEVTIRSRKIHKRDETLSDISSLHKIYHHSLELIQELSSQDYGGYASSIKNLYHYLAFQNAETKTFAQLCQDHGFASLEQSRPHIMETLIHIHQHSAQLISQDPIPTTKNITPERAKKVIQQREKILNKNPQGPASIMLTLPTVAATDTHFIEDAIIHGTNMVRINTAHDSPPLRKAMANNTRNVAKKLGKDVKIYVDLASRKIRTTEHKKVILPFAVAKKGPIQILLTNDQEKKTQGADQPVLVVSKKFVKKCKVGDVTTLRDARNKKRKLTIITKVNDAYLAQLEQKAVIDPTCRLKHKSGVTTKCKRFALSPEIITVTTGDTVILDGRLQTSYAAYSEDSTFHPAHIGISYPFILDYVEEQDSIYIDDGKIGLRVIQKHKKTLICKVTHTKGEISTIKPEKGINFPHSHIDVDAITTNDYHNLEEITQYADILGISFAQSSKDIHQLTNYLTKNGKENIAITAKIETPKAVERLPEILEALIQRGAGAVMIARGDLAVEVGFDTLATTQEHILALCQATHIPVIYATDILKNKMKKNENSRAEVIDASFAAQASCIMLNKGPYLIQALDLLQKIQR